jgi:malonyl-CoA O-methyltransferase
MQKEKTRAAFSRAARHYDQYATFQQQAARNLISLIQEAPSHILDLGCGTGECLFLVHRRFPEAELHGLDFAEGMISAAQKRSIEEKCPEALFVLGDMEYLPYPDESFDCLLSGMSAQWLSTFNRLSSEAERVLQPGGHFYFSTLLPGTLQELADTYFKVCGKKPPAMRFPALQAIKQSLRNSGFKILTCTEEKRTLQFGSFRALINSLSGIGAKTQNPNTLTKKQAADLSRKYPAGYPLTYRLVYLDAIRNIG